MFVWKGGIPIDLLGLNYIFFRVVGLCLLPLLGWIIGDWFILSLITSPLMLITFLGWKFVPESPRWLLSRPNRTQESAEIFRQIAKVNKMPEPHNLENRLQKISEEILKEKNYGYFSLFAYKGLAWKTFLLTITSFCANYTYNQLYYNLDNIGGNFFVNFFLLSVIEGPASYIALILAVSIYACIHLFVYMNANVCIGKAKSISYVLFYCFLRIVLEGGGVTHVHFCSMGLCLQ